MESTPVPCPYPGLRAFFTDERDWYFGRESHVNEALTRLEDSRFLAIVGSSGSGKSSLVFAGLIPALHDGELAGTLFDGAGNPAPWSIIDFKPGNAPLEELAKAIAEKAADRSDPLLANHVRAALHSGDLGLIEALKVAGHLQPGREVLVYVDQFEELFRFGEKSSIEEQENAQRFSRLLVAAAGQQEARLYLLLSMRSEFIGECERFPGLPELVSRSQFLTPRLTRKQLEQSLGLPATTVGWKVAPDALNAVLNDCGNSPDQLPLAQHVLRRMWMRAAAAGRTELTLDDYRETGGIRDSLAIHGNEILDSLPQPDGTDVARMLFMALCDQRDEGPLIRRLATRQEIELIAGSLAPLVGPVVAAFGGNDPGFIREDNGWLDVRHEAVLRQWPRIAGWREREVQSLVLLRQIADAVADYQRGSNKEELWRTAKLQRAVQWIETESPNEAWASRHDVSDWNQCSTFIQRSRETEIRLARKLQKERLKRWAMVAAIGSAAIFFGWQSLYRLRKNNAAELRQKELESAVEHATTSLVGATKGLSGTIDRLTPPLVESAKKSLVSLRDKRSKLLAALERDRTDGDPPDDGLIQAVKDARLKADDAVSLLENLQTTLASTLSVPTLASEEMTQESRELSDSIKVLKGEWEELRNGSGHSARIIAAIQARIARGNEVLKTFGTTPTSDPKQRDELLLAAAAQVGAIEALAEAAVMIGLSETDLVAVEPDSNRLEQSVLAAKAIRGDSPVSLLNWELKDMKGLIDHKTGNRLTGVRFIPPSDGRPLTIASSSEDKTIRFWEANGKPVDHWSTSSAINDIEVSPSGEMLAVASNGSTVRVLDLKNGLAGGKIPAKAFEGHSDSITDVEFDPTGKFVASASVDKTVRIFDAATLEETYASKKLPGIVTSAAFSPTGLSLVVSGSDDGRVRMHSPDLNGQSFVFNPPMGGPARRPEFSSDGKMVAAASGGRFARVWENRDPFPARQEFEHLAPVSQATFRPVPPSGTYPLITCCSNGEVRAWSNSLDGGPGKGLTPSHSGAVVFATWSASGTALATVGGGEVILWKWPPDHEFPAAVARINGLGAGTSYARFSPDSKLLATYGGTSVALLWDLSTLNL